MCRCKWVALSAGSLTTARVRPRRTSPRLRRKNPMARIPRIRRIPMPPENNDKTIKITLDDLANVTAPENDAIAPVQSTGGAKVYGSINEPVDPQTQVAEEKGSILLQAWFYLGLAGLIGALIGWGICEPWFVDGPGRRWGNVLIVPFIVALLCVGFGIAESVVERCAKKALTRGRISVTLGQVLGVLFY